MSGKLTLRVPKAIKLVLERNNAALAQLEAKLKAAEADSAALANLSAKLKAAEAQLASQAAAQVQAPAPVRANFAPTSMLPPPQTQAPLPPGWREATDPLSGRSYWFNAATQQTTWTNPSQAF